MMSRSTFKRRLSWLSAAVTALALISTPALAGSGVGDVFNLGQQNTVDDTSFLTGNVAAPQLRVVNANGNYAGIKGESAGGAGSAVFGLHSSAEGAGAGVLGYSLSRTGPGIYGVNKGGGPALSLWANPGVPPFTVNSTALVQDLNADQLDSVDSTGFWKLGGNSPASTAIFGTTSNQALDIEVNGQRTLRIEPGYAPNLIAGNAGNTVQAGVDGATIAGGGSPQNSPALHNRVTDNWGTVGGGLANVAGNSNRISGDVNSATVAGGNGNTASGSDSTVAGGYLNTASGRHSAVVGGSSNTASGSESVAAGLQSEASGAVSFAGGNRAVADDPHSFLWNDGNFFGSAVYGTVYSPAANSFSAHATGGFNFWTNPSGPITGCWIAQGGGSLNCSSSRKVKKDFAPVDRVALLRRLNSVPVTTWSYKHEKPGVRHIGAMAQDFQRAFQVGEDDISIAMVDADGVALAAIQGLYLQNMALRHRLSLQGARLSRLERLVTTLTRRWK